MKLDYDLIKEILKTIENDDSGSRKIIKPSSFKADNGGMKEYLRLNYHYKILFDIGLVVGDSIEDNPIDGSIIPVYFYYDGLTFEGHKTVEAMQNDTVWNRIEGHVKQAGIDGLRAAPGLALALIMGQ